MMSESLNNPEVKNEENYEVSSEYGADQIQILEGLEAVRKRPGMYIGSQGPRGLHHLVYEIVDNSVDEALAGACTEINVFIKKDNTTSLRKTLKPIKISPKARYFDLLGRYKFSK